MVKLAGTLSHFQPISALVVGDYMLDTYTTGRVKRISPEAPVPVMEVIKQESRPGGAGNVVLSLLALGAHVMAAGRIGDDRDGREIETSLLKDGANVESLFAEKLYRTPVKNRLIADSQQLLRVDQEKIAPISSLFEAHLMDKLTDVSKRAQVIALSDYGKGLLTPSLISKVIALARGSDIPIIVDPKGIDFAKYRGATILKPNLAEAYAAAKMELSEPLEAVAEKIHQITDIDYLLITRSESGISLFDRSMRRKDFPVRSREVKDVTGAGDTVLAVISAALANGLDLSIAVQLANIAAGIAIERLGCIQVTLAELAHRLLEFDADSKVFDDSHTFALSQVLKGKHYSLLVLAKGQKMSNALFRALRSLGRSGEEHLVVYVRDSHADDEFIHFLSSLQEVDTIILQTESLMNLCETIHPNGIFFLEKEKLRQFDGAQELLSVLRYNQTIVS
jgi:D-beta-D-heptose 7-phosphate kinase/D-beta-D-heptose 1-phosphate adenosyltransferase